MHRLNSRRGSYPVRRFGSSKSNGLASSKGSAMGDSQKSLLSLLDEDTSDIQVRIGLSTLEGKKPGKLENEDRGSCATPFSEIMLQDTILTGYAGVYDGHGGSHCASWIQEKMFQKVTEAFVDETSWKNGEELIREIFHELETEYCQLARSKGETSGTCGTVILVRRDEALVANIGDCRAIRCSSKGKVVFSTNDHRANCILEQRRIDKAGGHVKKGRIHSLEPSRTFGDIDVKGMEGGDVVISTPEVSRVDFHGTRGHYMIVASDGLWDKISNKVAAKNCKNYLGTKHDADKAAQSLVKLAREKGSEDDVTVAVLYF